MEIIQYEPHMKEDIRGICLATGSEKGRTDPVHGAFAKLFYCDPYIDNETALILVDEGKPVGYILCAEDYDAYEKHMAPYIEEIEKLGRDYPERVRLQLECYKSFKDRYPAHMHIDILEDYTGGGNGSKLLQKLIDKLKEDHVKGLMLGVSKDNKRACAFYRKNGFEVIEEDESGALLGMDLQ